MDLSTGARKIGCVFCKIIAHQAPAQMVDEGNHHVAFVPLNPFVQGHLLFVPRTHIEGPRESAALTGRVTEEAVRYAREQAETYGTYAQFNVIMSNGEAATQTVPHLHVHLIPRAYNDDSGWPWYGPPQHGFQEHL